MNEMYNPKTAIDKAFDALIGHEIRRINNHLPKQRKILKHLLAQDGDTTIEAIDGTKILLRRAELQAIGSIVPMEHHEKLRNPFIILRRMEMGKSTRSVYNSENSWANERLISRDVQHTEQLFLYKPKVAELVGKFHSLIVIAFGIPSELSDYARKRS